MSDNATTQGKYIFFGIAAIVTLFAFYFVAHMGDVLNAPVSDIALFLSVTLLMAAFAGLIRGLTSTGPQTYTVPAILLATSVLSFLASRMTS